MTVMGLILRMDAASLYVCFQRKEELSLKSNLPLASPPLGLRLALTLLHAPVSPPVEREA